MILVDTGAYTARETKNGSNFTIFANSRASISELPRDSTFLGGSLEKGLTQQRLLDLLGVLFQFHIIISVPDTGFIQWSGLEDDNQNEAPTGSKLSDNIK